MVNVSLQLNLLLLDVVPLHGAERIVRPVAPEMIEIGPILEV
jgi:hypothetical protein